jgi:hypothetical protein
MMTVGHDTVPMWLDDVDHGSNSKLEPMTLKDCVANGAIYHDAVIGRLLGRVLRLRHWSLLFSGTPRY